MGRDPVRQKLRHLLWQRGLTMKEASTAIGRSPSYVHQFLARGTPRALGYADADRLAALLGCKAAELRHFAPPKRRPQKRRRRAMPAAGIPGAPLAAVPEVAVEAAAGPGALNEEFAEEKARWFLPESMIRYEGDADPGNLRILRARGDSMEPLVSDGDRLLVDIARRAPGTGELAVLWDGGGLVVKRVEVLPHAEPPRLRLHSANPDYEPYTCLAEEAHMVGKVLWTLRRA
ncbi:MAG: LexA family transcriptional regulator [Rhodospirillaceae bacterium]|nr:LexA family transcriptional regulator [Rhodospirillaceae bacterium]